jgi:CBS domain-containing protein
MRVADVMETRVEVRDGCTLAEDAWTYMREHRLSSLVVTSGGRLTGVVSRDRLDVPDGPAGRVDRTLAEFLPGDPIAVPADYPIARAAGLLEGGASGCVAVLDHGRLVGVLTLSGLLRRLAAHGTRPCAS